ncbi:MAG: protein kinase [Candidatus Brocadiae bacterium]|nr:protein kinase [Candidatus Brocadiia bacterium]
MEKNITSHEDLIIQDFLESTGRISAKMLEEALVHHQKSKEEGTCRYFRETLIQEGYVSEDILSNMISGYTILDVLGEGKSGTVYKARQHSLERIVAIKILNPRVDASIGHFLRETYTFAKLDHPNIVKAFDSGRNGNVYYIVMEYFPGITLAQYMKGKVTLEENEALSIGASVFSALQYLWHKNLVHRDINPDNIMIHGEVVKICDLGLVRPVLIKGDQTTFRFPMKSSSYAFMSPEQLRGEKLSFKSDVYSFGVLMYFMLTGNYPVSIDKIATTEPYEISHPRIYQSGIHKKTAFLILKMLKNLPEERCQDTFEIENMFTDILREAKRRETRQLRRQKHPILFSSEFWIALLVASTLLLLFALLFYFPSRFPKEISQTPIKWNASQIYERCSSSVVLIRNEKEKNSQVSSTIGSGVIIEWQEKQLILTNAHVVDGLLFVKVELKDGNIFSGEVLHLDRNDDIAVIKIPQGVHKNSAIPLASPSQIKVGEDVFVIGHPKGYRWSLTNGTISAIRGDSIQTDAAINPGNSGGPVLNSQGLMVGLTKSVEGNSQSIGFAISVKKIQKFLMNLPVKNFK